MNNRLSTIITHKNELVARSVVGEINGLLKEPVSILRHIAILIETHRYDSHESSELLELVANTSGFFEFVALLDTDSVVLNAGISSELKISNENFIGMDLSGLELKYGEGSEHPVSWSEIFISPVTGRKIIYLNMKAGLFSVLGSFRIDHIYEIIERLATKDNLSLYISDGSGNLVFHRIERYVSEQFNLSNLLPVHNALNGVYGTYPYVFEGEEYIGSSAPIEETGWSLIVAQKKKVAYVQLRRLTFVFSLLVIASILIVIIIALGVTKHLMTPLGQFQESVRAITDGHFEKELPIQPFMEFESLALHIRSMAGAIHDREKRLGISEERYRELFNSPSDVFIIINASSGNIIQVNRATEEMYGYSREEALSLNIEDLSSGEHPYTQSEALKKVEAARLEGPQMFEWHARKKSGEMFWVEVSLKYTRIQDTEYIIAVVRDISNRRMTEKQLLKWGNIFEQYPWGVVILSNDRETIDLMNPAYLSMHGFSANQLNLKFFSDVFPSSFHDTLKGISQSWLPDTHNTFEAEHIRKDGTVFMAKHDTVVVSGDSGATDYVIVNVQDISEKFAIETEKKELETQLSQTHKMEALGTLAGGIAHDFNNIIAVIAGYAELAGESLPENSDEKTFINEVLTASTRAKELVQHILTFSRKADTERRPVQIHLIINETLRMLRAVVPSNVEFNLNIDSKTGAVLANSAQIHQIVLNLCTNAVHAMGDEGGVLGVELGRYELTETSPFKSQPAVPGTYARLEITDTGSGISEEDLKKIFDPFFTTKEVGRGTGMGLSVVHGIVTSYEGCITVDSSQGRGTSFQVYIPLCSVRIRETVFRDRSLPTGTESILVVDDEKGVAEMTRKRLERLGYNVRMMTDSRDALDLFESSPDSFDLVLTDQTMPGMTGRQLCYRIREIRNDIPVILCTGYSSGIDADSAKAEGVNAFLMKPADSQKLADVIREVLDKSGQ